MSTIGTVTTNDSLSFRITDLCASSVNNYMAVCSDIFVFFGELRLDRRASHMFSKSFVTELYELSAHD